MEETDAKFDSIMEKVGNCGRFQLIFNMIYVGVIMANAMAFTNLVLALNVPDHWCYVPGLERTNFTIEQWRTITLPTKLDNRGEERFDMCQMYNVNFTNMEYWEFETLNKSNLELTNCIHGYQYDKEWYDETIVTKENWVCDKDMNYANTFVASRIAESIGTFVFGHLGDTIGRELVYYISILLVVVGRIMTTLTTGSYIWFIGSIIIGSLAINTVFLSPLIIAMEFSTEDQRSNIALKQAIAFTLGTCIIPFIYWGFRHWEPFMWITSVTVGFALLLPRYTIESPRWLISRRRYRSALIQFKKMARINGKKFDMTEAELKALYASQKKEHVYGMASLFSSWRLARTTVIMSYCWCVEGVTYFTLLLYISRMKGNPFLNFFLQCAVEIPAYVVGKFLCEKIGRRFTNCSSFFSSAITCMFIIAYSTDPKYESAMIYAATFMKFLNGLAFFTANLQAMEMYPTCLRQTGISLGVFITNVVGVLSPYFVYLGTTYDIRYPYYILLSLLFLAGSSGLFLPETLHQKLPDSLEEVQKFGHNQKFWHIPKKPKIIVSDDPLSEKAKLNDEMQNGL